MLTSDNAKKQLPPLRGNDSVVIGSKPSIEVRTQKKGKRNKSARRHRTSKKISSDEQQPPTTGVDT
jgi:hypothetical protein